MARARHGDPRQVAARAMTGWAMAGIAWCLCANAAEAMPSGEDGKRVAEANAAIHDLEIERASAALNGLVERHPEDADVLDAAAMVEFHRGNYPLALTRIRAANRADTSPVTRSHRADLIQLFENTVLATERLVEFQSDDGRYRVKVSAGRDEVLVPYALEALARADEEVSAVLGYRHPGPIRLEVYDSPAVLAQVSTLSEEEIERTGTIALCKWDRLMITSPRALVRGYPWMDTIGHEFVHLNLARATRDHAPVWLQEGVAKYLEVRWRRVKALRLDPAAEALLHDGITNDKLIPFDRLHPSIARLPSQEDAALAFAQVATFIAHLVETHGEGALRTVVHEVHDGRDARDAIARATDSSWPEAEGAWKKAIAKRPVPTAAAPRHIALRFKRGEGVVDETTDVAEAKARKHMRLGDLLWGHGRAKGASAEYSRAQKAAPDDPHIASRLARATLEAGDGADKAVAALLPLRDRYPQHAPLRALLGAAFLAQGNHVEARHELLEAIWLNPFDPAPHCGLASVAATDLEKTRESADCASLR